MILQADARRIPLRDGCVQTCITSPPYWGLRDYQTARWDGGDNDCDHIERTAEQISKSNGLGPNGYLPPTNAAFQSRATQFRSECGKCGARRIDLQIGLEPTPEAYVATMVEVFREVRRVLRHDGTCWLNLGDSYSGGNKGNSGLLRPGDKQATNRGSYDTRRRDNGTLTPARNGGSGLEAKQLLMIPARVALALQADGWYLRSDIIWAKPNPMPESVSDRPTRSHEYIFLLSKSERYYFDADAIREPHAVEPHAPGNKFDPAKIAGPNNRNGHSQWEGDQSRIWAHPNGRNKRSVWTVNSEPTPEAHFATFPQKLIEPCILAGSRPGDLVFDPFLGSGTVGKVAERFGRRWVGLELSADYIGIAEKRTAQMGLKL